MRGAFTTEFTTKRLTIVSGKSSYATLGSGSGFFRTMSDEMAMLNSLQAGQGFTLNVDSDIDILPTDRVTISGTDYDVKAVGTHELRGLSYKKAILTKGLNNS
jgi:hypothetical protein